MANLMSRGQKTFEEAWDSTMSATFHFLGTDQEDGAVVIHSAMTIARQVLANYEQFDRLMAEIELEAYEGKKRDLRNRLSEN